MDAHRTVGLGVCEMVTSSRSMRHLAETLVEAAAPSIDYHRENISNAEIVEEGPITV